MFVTRDKNQTITSRGNAPGRFVELSAGVTHYELRGDSGGRTVVLIHGNAAPYVTWDNTIDALTGAGLRVLRYDLFGHGLSDRPKLRTYDRTLYTTQLAELLASLDSEYPVRLVGSSQGGSIGACFAAANPEHVEKLALLSPLFDDFIGSKSLLASLMKTPILGEVLLRLASESKLTDLSNAILSDETRTALEHEVAKQFRVPGKRRAILANWRGDALRNAKSCYEAVRDQGIPTLLTWGTLDEKIPGESMVRLRELLPDVEYHEIEGVGHLAHYEFADRINPLLVRFLTT